MFDLYVPFLIGTAMGISPEEAASVAEPAAIVVMEGSNNDAATRVPEEQIPLGKYTTALEVKPILGMTKSNWVAVRDFNGQDLLYFTHLLAWRCGMWDIKYGLNGEDATQTVPMEPCHEDLAAPNSLVEIEDYLPYVTLPAGSVESVYVEITYDDGTTDFARFNRNDIAIP
ncbi:hypothetical protein SAMN04488515_1671 [Cognatiyoonia koreensis]|uniref:Uncharacterized protein n=1 Tax=Cognatiyoonia koreensis TaxID=364200 RepID=A0A1I0Q4Z1_9RHOB|nr:hypothetical protein [Cognatiyoonia koreensis]SEW21990.1 hypothetical protein SAMN04488515_1671 [Cognatiyoonia koreensis]